MPAPEYSLHKFLFWVVLAGLFGARVSFADELPRRITLGVQAKPVSAETQTTSKLRNNRGVEVVATVPDSAAAAAGLKSGDVLLAVGGKPLLNVPDFIDQVSQLRSDGEFEIRLNRAGEERTVKIASQPLPQEHSDEFDIVYASVPTSVGRLRTVLTVPRGEQKRKAIVLLAGLGLGFVEHPIADPLGMRAVAYELTKAGFAVLRVDRPGCGDSQGGPARDADFQSIVEGYVAGVRSLKQHPKVDVDNVYLLGFSAGALEAPLVAQQAPVKGIAIFGGLTMNWQEYLQSTTRRQLRLAGIPAGEIERITARQSAGWHYLIYEDKSPDEIAADHSDLSEWVDENWSDGKYFSGIHYKFFQQLGKTNIAQAWDKFQGPVLALFGEQDVVADRAEQEWIVEIANRKQTGQGTFQVIPGVDHNLQLVANEKKGNSTVPFALIEAVTKWAQP